MTVMKRDCKNGQESHFKEGARGMTKNGKDTNQKHRKYLETYVRQDSTFVGAATKLLPKSHE